jgi:sarcosine oxidase subunit gamma
VAEIVLAPRAEPEMKPGRIGHAHGPAGIRLSLRSNLALASVIARKGQADALAQRIKSVFSLDLPRTPKVVRSGDIALVWAGPGQWLAAKDNAAGHAFEAELRDAFAGLASVSDQSDGRVVFHARGPRARDVLQKGVLIDLHPGAFKPGDVAVTPIAHIGTHLWQVDDTPAYEIAVFRSFADAFRHWLEEAGAEFGMDVAVEA